MTRLVAEAEAEQRRQRKKIRSVEPNPAIDMDSIVADAETELRRGRSRLDQGKQHMAEVFEQANAIRAVLDFTDGQEQTESSRDEEMGMFFVGQKEVSFPAVKNNDSLMYRAEALRAFLEEELGMRKFTAIYRFITDGDDGVKAVERITRGVEPGLVVLVQQLLILDETISEM
jgi:hypothetical protein